MGWQKNNFTANQISSIMIRYAVILIFVVSFVALPLSSFALLPAVYDNPIYWINGPGDYDDTDHWSYESGGSPAGILPNYKSDIIFDSESGMDNGEIVTIPSGMYIQNSIHIETDIEFEIHLEGSSNSSSVEMYIYQDLSLLSNVLLTYQDSMNNKWIFSEVGEHYINTGNNEMIEIEFSGGDAQYNQDSDITAIKSIRMESGEWHTNGYDVTTESLRFTTEETKELHAYSSDIYSDEFNAKLVYGSLTLNGTYTIHTNQFTGAPKQSNGPIPIYHKIILGELQDENPNNGISNIEYNNFECVECEIHTILVEDSGRSQFANIFTVTDLFEIKTKGLEIYFNGGNGRPDTVIFQGDIVTPTLTDVCDRRVLLSNIYNDEIYFKSSNSLYIDNVILNNVHTLGNGNFTTANSVALGSTNGWEEIDLPDSQNYYWKGTGSGALWQNINNWILEDGSTPNCLPSIVDNVFIDNSSNSDILIDSYSNAVCNDFTWTNQNDLTLDISQNFNQASASLSIKGSFVLDEHATFTADGYHNILLVGNEKDDIDTKNVLLPNVYFIGESSEWYFLSDFKAENLSIESGSLFTQGVDVTVEDWLSIDEGGEINYYFSDSHIVVNGEFRESTFSEVHPIIHTGNYLIECEEFNVIVEEINNLTLNNSSTFTFNDHPLKINTLTLNSISSVRNNNTLEIETLILNSKCRLEIDPQDSLIVTNEILSLGTLSGPAFINSTTSGIAAKIYNKDFHLCALGHIEYSDIESEIIGILHSPQGINSGNVIDINFEDSYSEENMYWIGDEGNWEEYKNWSHISGGCPTDVIPNIESHVIFDTNSVLTNNPTVMMNNPQTVQLVTSDISDKSISIDVVEEFQLNNLNIDSGTIAIKGTNVILDSETNIAQNGFLLVLSELFECPSININEGQLQSANNSVIIVD